MIFILWALGLLGACALTAYAYKKTDIAHVIIVGLMTYFSLYIIVSGLLIWFDIFSIERSEILTIIVSVLGTVGLAFFSKKKVPEIIIRPWKIVPIAILFVIFTLLSGNKGELYSTSQDQGLYEIKALMYMNGENDNVLSLDEFYEINDSMERAVYIDALKGMDGIYLLNADIYSENCSSEYEIHGIGTFAALLALWGSMFGYVRMSGILTLFLLCTVGGAWLVCDNLGLKPYVSLMVAALTGICPVVMWSSKNILTEAGLCMLVAMFFVYISEEPKRRLIIWSALPLVAFSFYHISITYMLPMFVVIYVYSYFYTKKSDGLYAFIIMLLGYASGLSMMYASSPIYTTKNLANIFVKTHGLLTNDNYRKIVWVGVIVVSIILLVINYLGLLKKLRTPVKTAINKPVDLKKWRIIAMVVCLVIIGLQAYLAYKSVKVYGLDLMKQCFIGVVILTGFIMVPIAMIGFVISIGHYLKDFRKVVMAVALIYVLTVLAGLIFYSINYYYYYARYLAPYMMLVFICAAFVMDFFKAKYVVPVCILTLAVMAFNSRLLYTHRDLTYGDFQVVKNIASCADNKDCIVMLADANRICNMLMFPVKAVTDADMYFVNYNRFDDQMTELSNRYEDVFLLTYNSGFNEDGSQPWNLVYDGVLHSSIYAVNYEKGFPYPKAVDIFDSNLGLYIYTGELVGY